jgi:hypothetical protein
VADQLRRLIEHAVSQGWRVEPHSNARLRWQAPDGGGLVFTPDRMGQGRDLTDIVVRLQRAGLRLRERQTRARGQREEEPMPATQKASAPPNGAVSSAATPGATLAEVLLDAASKVDGLLRRNAELERENGELRHELASARTRAADVRREALAAVERVLAERGVS